MPLRCITSQQDSKRSTTTHTLPREVLKVMATRHSPLAAHGAMPMQYMISTSSSASSDTAMMGAATRATESKGVERSRKRPRSADTPK